MNPTNAIKMIVTYDIKVEALQDYYQFVMGKYLPAMQQEGFEMLEAWSTIYGDAPDRIVSLVARNADDYYRLLESEEWPELNETLLEFVTNLEFKFVYYREGIQS